MTIDIVRLLYSPKMVRLYPRPAAASRLHTCMQLTQFTINTRAVPQLLNNIKEAKEVLAAASPEATLIPTPNHLSRRLRRRRPRSRRRRPRSQSPRSAGLAVYSVPTCNA
eukprot:scaffold13206_cov67-Phaeocystis_antarctica.AAC.2